MSDNLQWFGHGWGPDVEAPVDDVIIHVITETTNVDKEEKQTNYLLQII